MTGRPILNRENAERWFASLTSQLGEYYPVAYTDIPNGGFHLDTIYFEGAAFHLALYVVEYGGEYMVVLCEMEGTERKLHKAWKVIDTRHVAAGTLNRFCGKCLVVHVGLGCSCPPVDAAPLIWDNPSLDTEERLFDSLSRRIVNDVNREFNAN
jgi:hypothetical protein